MAKQDAGKCHDISILRILATFAVVFLHTCNTLANNADSFQMTEGQHTVLFTGTFCMNWAVPVFLMITGCLLLNEKKVITPSDCILKYTKRALLALIVFGVPFAFLELFMKDRHVTVQTVLQCFYNVITGQSWSHLWYLYTLIGLYITLPIWKSFVNHSDRKTQRYILVCLFVFNFCFTILNAAFDMQIAFVLPTATNAVFYLLAGKYFRDEVPHFLADKKKNIVLLVLLFLMLIGISAMTYPDGSKYLGYSSPVIAVISILIFVTMRGCRIRNTDTLWKMDRLCFAVYLIHPVFINFMYKYLKITPLSFGLYIVMVFVFWIGFTAASFIGSWVMSKIPLLKKIL